MPTRHGRPSVKGLKVECVHCHQKFDKIPFVEHINKYPGGECKTRLMKSLLARVNKFIEKQSKLRGYNISYDWDSPKHGKGKSESFEIAPSKQAARELTFWRERSGLKPAFPKNIKIKEKEDY